MIVLNNLTYRYRKGAEALTDVSASIGPGIHLLLGENGAGKTTLLHVMAGLLYPSSGECLIDGEDASRRLLSELSRMFFLGDNMPFPAKTINEMSRIHAVFYPGFDPVQLQENLKSFGLTGDEPIAKMSLGNRHKSQVAYALALRTDILLLDEPANGLDISAKQALQSMIASNVNEEQTVIISTHTVNDFTNLFDGVIVLSRSHMLMAMNANEITSRVTFTVSSIPAVNPIYGETRINMFHSIVENTDGEDSDIDYILLYNAIMNASSRPRLLQLLNNNDNEQHD